MRDKRPQKFLHVSVAVGRTDFIDEKTGMKIPNMPTRTPIGGGATARRAFPKPESKRRQRINERYARINNV